MLKEFGFVLNSFLFSYEEKYAKRCGSEEAAMFIDQAKIYICAGKGGNGHVSFHTQNICPTADRRGDGGRGGCFFCCERKYDQFAGLSL